MSETRAEYYAGDLVRVCGHDAYIELEKDYTFIGNEFHVMVIDGKDVFYMADLKPDYDQIMHREDAIKLGDLLTNTRYFEMMKNHTKEMMGAG